MFHLYLAYIVLIVVEHLMWDLPPQQNLSVQYSIGTVLYSRFLEFFLLAELKFYTHYTATPHKELLICISDSFSGWMQFQCMN